MFDDPKPDDTCVLNVSLEITIDHFKQLRKSAKSIFGSDDQKWLSKVISEIVKSRLNNPN